MTCVVLLGRDVGASAAHDRSERRRDILIGDLEEVGEVFTVTVGLAWPGRPAMVRMATRHGVTSEHAACEPPGPFSERLPSMIARRPRLGR